MIALVGWALFWIVLLVVLATIGVIALIRGRIR